MLYALPKLVPRRRRQIRKVWWWVAILLMPRNNMRRSCVKLVDSFRKKFM